MTAETAAAVTTKVEEKPRFSKIEPIGYALGDIGNGFYFQLVSNYAMIYLTDALGISPAITGGIIFAGKLISAFTDFGFGVAADKAPLREDGRYHWFVKTFRYPLMAAIVLFFLPFVSSWAMPMRILWATALYIIGVFFYSGVSAPYGSFASVSTPVVKNRDAMAAGRGFGSTAGGIIVGFILPLVIFETVNGQKTLKGQSLIWVALIFIALMWICYEITLRLTRERIRVDKSDKDQVPLTKALSAMFSNRAMVAIMIAALLLIFSQMFAGAVNTYLYKDYFNNTFALSVLAFQNVPALILAPFAPAICDKVGKKAACGFTLAISAIMFLAMFFMQISDPWIFVALSFVANLGNGFFGLMIWSFITDIIDDIQVKTHTREDGTVYTGYMFFRKIGQAISGLLSGVALGATGYVVAQSGQSIAQPEGVLSNIYAVATLAPAIGYGLIALVILFLYPLSGRITKDNAAILEVRREHGEL
ncbi:MFS transporter [Bifidobacterium psychraerophilum]|uniref:MFS transporter n=1 Tax=Bifidobacterium psychraerophilum TaxID=218140 RepID=UPI00310EB621